MKGDVDQHLMVQLDEAGEEGEVEAVILVEDTVGAATTPDKRGSGGRLIDRVTEQLQQQPTEVRFMPNLGVLFVRSSGKFVRKLLEANEVISASATDAEITRL